MTDIKEEEIWKTHPDYPFLQANQFGEIRTTDRIITRSDGRKQFVKGHILKQYLHKSGYMYVKFSMNRKTVNLSVHRVVATCFISNPFGLPEVNHKDNNPQNNTASNLEWCSSQYNQDYKKNFGTSQAELFGRPVFAVNLKTGKVLRFESQHEASQQLGVDVRNLNKVVKGKLNQTGGYWFTEDENETTEEKIREIKIKTHFFGGVIAINPETSEVFWFKSQSEAGRKLGVNSKNINSVVKGKRNKAGGYWFCCADETAVEKTRKKFGDKIASKVKELMSGNHD